MAKAEKKNTDKEKKSFFLGHRFLFMLIMMTWLFIGIEVMINNLGAQNANDLSLQVDKNSEIIVKQQKSLSNIAAKILMLSERLDKFAKELDLITKQSLPKSPYINEKEEISSDQESDEDELSSLDNITGSQNASSEFEQASFASSHSSELSQKNAEIELELNELQKKLVQNKMRSAYHRSLLVASIDLKNAVESQQSFNKELTIIHKIAMKSGDPILNKEIATLAPFSPEAIKTPEQLKTSFPEISDAINNAEKESNSDGSLLDKAKLNLSGIISIRKVDAEEGNDDVANTIARTHKYLSEGQLSAALDEMRKLPIKSQKITKKWMNDLENYLKTTQTTKKIFDYVARESYIYEPAK